MSSIKDSLTYFNLLGAHPDPDWVVYRYPFTDADDEVIAKMQPGYLVKFDSDRTHVLPAVSGGSDDAALDGIIVDLPKENDVNKTVAVAQQGTFNENAIHYASAWEESPVVALTAAAKARLAVLGIFLEPAIKAGPFAP
jgi:hypothetical protein